MRVSVNPADEGGCGAYRCIWPAKAAQAAGHDVILETDRTYDALWRDTIQGPQLIGMHEQIDADVFVCQRPFHRNRVEFLRAVRAEGIATVVEIDDDFHAIHPQNPAWKFSNPLHDRDRNRDWLMKACREADLVTVTTPALAERYAPHGRVAIVPNYVPAWYCEIPRAERDEPVLGWSGSVATHPTDLQVCGDAFAEYHGRFQVVGTGWGVRERLGLPVPPAATDWLLLEHYPHGLALVDVGIVPLAPIPFNEAKSWLKGLEFAALGVPFVASATGPYRELAARGFGAVAETPGEWRDLVFGLTRVDLRTIGDAYRAKVAESYTIEGNVDQWMSAWSQAIDNAARREAA